MDALSLWVAALRNTVTIESVQGAPALFELFPTAVAMLDNLDVLGKVTSILQSYFLLNASAILQVRTHTCLPTNSALIRDLSFCQDLRCRSIPSNPRSSY